MIFDDIPTTIDGLETQRWETYRPYFEELLARDVTPETLRQWLVDWSRLTKLIEEAGAMIYVNKSLDTADKQAEQAFLDFVSEVQPAAAVADQALKERLLAMEPSGTAVADLALVLRDMQNEADLFRDENVPLDTALAKLGNEYDKITGAMVADWDGEEKNLSQLSVLLADSDRAVRERAWRQIMALWLADRERLNELFTEMLALRRQLAENADLSDYRAYSFREKNRFDYTPEECFTFHDAIEAVVVPAAARIYARKQERLGLESLRPWDVDVDASGAPRLEPYDGQDELVQGSLNIFQQVDPVLARHFATMAEEHLLDLDTRSGKALGGYCMTLPLRQRPFIFMNGAGRHDDVQTMLHEAGHAFHVFEGAGLPLAWQLDSPMEFAEVASMSMELLAAPYLTEEYGGFYTSAEAARARIEHLEGVLTFLPYMAVVDGFQHWVYTHPDEAADATKCDAAWGQLWERFMPGIDYTGLEDERVSGWHRKLHIFHIPFYYIEYGMAQVGALQVWRNALSDQAGAVAAYRAALALGGTASLPELFAAAGAEFRFDEPMLRDLVLLVEGTIAELETQI
jgi:oligoendopeptidase F